MLGVLIVLCCVLVQWWWRRRGMLRLAAKVPAFPRALPVIGHAYKIVGRDSCNLFNVIKEISEFANSNGGIGTIWLRMKPHFVLTDPKDTLTALNSCLDKSYVYDFLKPWLGEGLLTSIPSIWVHHRRMLNPAFSPLVLNTFQSIFDKQARKLAQLLGQNAGAGVFDPSALIGYTFLETLYETSFGLPSSNASKETENYGIASRKMLESVIKRFLNTILHFEFIFNWTQLKREQDELVKELHTYSRQVIEKRKGDFNNIKLTDSTENKIKPFIQLLLELKNTKGAFSDKEMREEIDIMIFAGQDTSALLFHYVIIMLGSYPEVQEKVYEELKEIFGDEDRDVMKEDLGRLVYMEAVINETLRLYPIAAVVLRDVHKDLKLTNYTLPAGSTVIASFWGMHRGAHWGPDAAEFRPERWLDPASLPNQSSAFGGFSLGKRMCIGKAYAMMSLKTSIAHFMRWYRVHADHTQLRMKLDFVARPVSGHFITIEERSIK